MNSRWLYITLGFAAVIAILHLYGLAHYYYWHHRWFDTPLHLLGGALVGCLIFTFIGRPGPITYLMGILAIAVGWELFEYYFSISTGQSDYWFDTFHDIANGITGGLLLYSFSDKSLWRSV